MCVGGTGGCVGGRGRGGSYVNGGEVVLITVLSTIVLLKKEKCLRPVQKMQGSSQKRN